MKNYKNYIGTTYMITYIITTQKARCVFFFFFDVILNKLSIKQNISKQCFF